MSYVRVCVTMCNCGVPPQLDAILGELGTPRDTDSQLLDRSLEDDQDLNRDDASEDDLPDYDNDLDDFSEEQMYSGHRVSVDWWRLEGSAVCGLGLGEEGIG